METDELEAQVLTSMPADLQTMSDMVGSAGEAGLAPTGTFAGSDPSGTNGNLSSSKESPWHG
jgi:hypothetical protein